MTDGTMAGRAGSRRLSRRAMLGGIAGSAVAAILAACGGSSPTATPAATKAAATSAPTTASGSAPAATTANATTGAASAAAPATVSSGGAASAAPTTAATQAASAGPVKMGGTLKTAIGNENLTLDPLTSGYVSERQLYYNMYDSLVAIDTSLKIIPNLAESWDTPDPTTYIFHLRQGVKFHDGTDFNADAVKFNLDRYLNDKTSRRAGEISFIQSTDVVDPYTVKVTLKQPFSPFLANLVDRAGMMLSPKAIQAGGQDFSRKPVGAGTGAFRFVEWVQNDHMTMDRNPNYWKKDASGNQLPYLDKIIWHPITDSTVLLANLKTGDIDASYYVAPKDVAGLKGSTDVILEMAPGLSFDAFEFNTQKEPFNKKELRQAVAEAIDRDQISKTVYFGTELVGYGPLPPSSWAYDASLKPYSASVDKAKQYMAAGGMPNGFTFEYKLASGSPVGQQLLQLVKDQVAKAGITLNITQLDSTVVSTDAQNGNFQATGYGWSGRIDPDGNIYNFLHTGGGLSDTKYSNPQVDDLLDKARATSDQAQRKGFYQQAVKMLADDAPMAWWGFAPSYYIHRPNVQNVQLYADYIMRLHAAWLK
jgi:peptide/nickel transport system substrate-binding protein